MKSNLTKTMILLFVFLSSSLSATTMLPQSDIKKQKEITSIESFKEFETELLRLIKLGDKSKLVVLGSLYLNEFPFKQKDVEKGVYYLNLALAEGYGLSALPLSYEKLNKGNIEDALLVLEDGINKSEKDLNSQVVLSVLYNGLVLDTKMDNMRYIHKALDLTYPVSQKTNKSSLDFTIANLLNLAGNHDEANKYLNTACNNPEVEDNIKQACENSMGITNNLKKSKECDTCGVLK